MIKRIIFDFDNTLIKWKEEYWKSIDRALEKYGIIFDEDDSKKIKIAIDNFEYEYEIYKKEYMIECINKYSKLNLDIRYVDLWIEELSKCAPDKIENEIIETLEYLYKKYELVILTNWYYESQYNRLKKARIDKYFKKMYTPETYKMKPNKESFEIAADGKIEESIMVGDSFKTDIEGAINAGMKAIHIDKKQKENIENKDYIVIKNFEELKEIL